MLNYLFAVLVFILAVHTWYEVIAGLVRGEMALGSRTWKRGEQGREYWSWMATSAGFAVAFSVLVVALVLRWIEM